MNQILSFFLLSLMLVVPMAHGFEKDVDDKILNPNEMKFDEDSDTSMKDADDKILIHSGMLSDEDASMDGVDHPEGEDLHAPDKVEDMR